MPAHPIAQVITHPRLGYSALFPIQPQFQALVQETLNTDHHPLASAPAAYVNVRIVGITHETMTPPCQLLVELVEQDVRQQRRERAALRRPFLPSTGDPA